MARWPWGIWGSSARGAKSRRDDAHSHPHDDHLLLRPCVLGTTSAARPSYLKLRCLPQCPMTTRFSSASNSKWQRQVSDTLSFTPIFRCFNITTSAPL